MPSIIIPEKYFVRPLTKRPYKILRGRSPNFNEELRQWLKEHNGYAVWAKINPISSAPSLYFTTWKAVFKTNDDLVLFKLTWEK